MSVSTRSPNRSSLDLSHRTDGIPRQTSSPTSGERNFPRYYNLRTPLRVTHRVVILWSPSST